MTASQNTVEQIYAILSRRVTRKQLQSILGDLLSVPGNKSFRDTVARLMELHKSRSNDYLVPQKRVYGHGKGDRYQDKKKVENE